MPEKILEELAEHPCSIVRTAVAEQICKQKELTNLHIKSLHKLAKDENFAVRYALAKTLEEREKSSTPEDEIEFRNVVVALMLDRNPLVAEVAEDILQSMKTDLEPMLEHPG